MKRFSGKGGLSESVFISIIHCYEKCGIILASTAAIITCICVTYTIKIQLDLIAKLGMDESVTRKAFS